MLKKQIYNPVWWNKLGPQISPMQIHRKVGESFRLRSFLLGKSSAQT